MLNFLRPDGKSQVSVEYVGSKPKRIDAVVISTQHSADVTTEQLRAEVKKHIIDAGGSAPIWSIRRPSTTSTPPAASWSADRTATPG